MKTPIAITGIASISPLGISSEEQWQRYLLPETSIEWNPRLEAYVAALSTTAKDEILKLRAENTQYKRLDDTVLYGIYTARKAIRQAGWFSGDFGINVGSSRGATQLFEKYFTAFAKANTAQTLASPSTTLGNISSWIAQDLQSSGPDISHSITCSTALHAVLNGVAWLQSGLASKFMVGGTEAALTPFTIAQMKAMKLTPKAILPETQTYPCRALDLEKNTNSMVLGEGAGMACLEAGRKDNALAYIEGIGYATEVLEHSVSLSSNGDCFQKAMQMAIGDLDPKEIDAIVMHAPGTIKGDLAEMEAIKTVFADKLPILTTNKWKIGHTFGASGLLSLELAIGMLQHQSSVPVPFIENRHKNRRLQKILINAVGFGGNAVSILLQRA